MKNSFWILLLVFLMAACTDDGSTDSSSGDTETSSDGDSDTDTDTDTDTDSDTDTDTDTDADSDTDGGVLSIIGLKEAEYGAEYTSGRLNSEFEVPNDPGTLVEGRIKLSKKNCTGADDFVNGTWPSIWMLGSDSSERGYGGGVQWPGCGEIDINEWLGSDADHFQTNQWGTPAFPVDHNSPAVVNYGADGPEKWHTYGVRFNGDALTYVFDGVDQATKSYNDADDHAHRIILNMALGGDMGGTIAADFVSEEIQIDWVRVTDQGGNILWQDEMDDEAATKSKWFTFVGMAYNNEKQYYTNWDTDNFMWHSDLTRGECN